MFFTDKEKGLRTLIKMRYGLAGYPDWRGINKQSDRGAIDRNQFVDLVNLRNSGGSWDVRGGLSAPVNANALTGCVQGFIDLGGAPVLTSFLVNGTYPSYFSGDDVLTAVDVVNATITRSPLDLFTVMPFAAASSALTATPRKVSTLHNGEIYFINVSGGISTLVLPATPNANLTLTRVVTQVVPPLGLSNPNFITSAFGKLWVGDNNGLLVSWDGATVTEEADFGTGVLLLGCQYNESFCVITPTNLQVLNPNGTWTSVALPALPGSQLYARCINSCPTVGKLYIGGYADNAAVQDAYLLEFDGSTITAVFSHSPSSSPGADFYHGVLDVVEWNGVATFIWFKEDPGLALGFIGTVATPEAVQIGGADTARPAAVSLFVDSDEVLYAGMNARYDAGDPNHVIRRNGSTLGGNWLSDASNSGWTSMGDWGVGGTNYPPFQMQGFL